MAAIDLIVLGMLKKEPENFHEKENNPDIPETGMAVLRQQFVLVEAIEKWIADLKNSVEID